MVGGALNTAAEQILEYAAHGHLMREPGNASPFVEQAVLRCAGEDEWVAITLPNEDNCNAPGRPAPRSRGSCDLRAPCHPRRRRSANGSVCRRPAGLGARGRHLRTARARDFFEDVSHPVTGTHPYIAFPVRVLGRPHRWNRHPSPTLGADNERLLGELGYESAEIADLDQRGVIATTVASSQQGCDPEGPGPPGEDGAI